MKKKSSVKYILFGLFFIIVGACIIGKAAGVLPEIDNIAMLQILLAVLQGNHPKHRKVLYFQTDSLRLESPEYVSTDVDGEHGEKFPLEFSVLPKKLRIFVKKKNNTDKDGEK